MVRFDRPTPGALSARPHVEDGCQAFGRPPGDKDFVGYAASFGVLAAVCNDRLLAVRANYSSPPVVRACPQAGWRSRRTGNTHLQVEPLTSTITVAR